MGGNTREQRLDSGDATMEEVGGLAALVPAQARPVDLVYRPLGSSGAESDTQRDVAAAAARTAVAGEIEKLRPGEPYVLQQGRVADYPGIAPELPPGEILVFGVVYRFGE
ncbi:hypothetical protein [Streptomonospora wellingtoniae]|uniref:Uncharacterized protein n=1 Tax=Streptomonospora wellingtoniae TaxID=3075544 RepID=A0ABU2KU93_9ACTN|nr:hypothetical protein [Streptomonospora sp. DSM 45055]MDT0302820.1 hypothetical protein [Streptomonospora sp. DSM 45055]